MAKRKRSKKEDKTVELIIKIVLWIAFLPFVALYYLIKLIVKKASKAKAAQAASNEPLLPMDFEAVGVHYRTDAVVSIAQESRNFNWPDEKILEKFSGGTRIWRYFFSLSSAELVPEPDNPHDPNAIKVVVDGVHIAYIPRELCSDVAQRMSQGFSARITIKGGPYKYVEDGTVYTAKEDFRVFVKLTYEY